MKIEGDKYLISYNESSQIINFSGKLGFNGMDDALDRVVSLFNSILDQEPAQITLNLCDLEFLNSLGISTISKFIIKIRNKKSIRVAVKASNQIAWQHKALINLQRIMPSLTLEWD